MLDLLIFFTDTFSCLSVSWHCWFRRLLVTCKSVFGTTSSVIVTQSQIKLCNQLIYQTFCVLLCCQHVNFCVISCYFIVSIFCICFTCCYFIIWVMLMLLVAVATCCLEASWQPTTRNVLDFFNGLATKGLFDIFLLISIHVLVWIAFTII